MSLAKLAWVILTNLPTIIKWVKEMVDYFDGDHKEASLCVGELCKATLPEKKLEPKAEIIKAAKLRLLRRKVAHDRRKSREL